MRDEAQAGAMGSPDDGSAALAVLPRYSEDKCPAHSSPALVRADWLQQVGRRTRAFRAAQALRYRGRARNAALHGQANRSGWHSDRARGQVERFERVSACGEREILSRCDDCRTETRRLEARCSHFRLCVVCRGHRASRYRARVRIARKRTLDEAQGLTGQNAPGGGFRERFLTLTLRHSGDVVRDLRSLPKAWSALRKRLWKFFEHQHGLDRELRKRVAFVRVIEATPGTEGEGHAHLHVYLFCPYLPEELVRHLWGQALVDLGYEVPTRPLADVLNAVDSKRRRVQLQRVLVTRRGPRGLPLGEVFWPIIQVKGCYGDVANELVKYLVKDAELEEGKLKLVDPALYARIYEGLEGLRTVATSRNFFVKGDSVCRCEACGSSRLSSRIVDKPEAPADSANGGKDD